ncbi:MAG TPA: non-heme iron oxygenase ferredoxin subunit [Gemmatimonadales bacterium]
MSDDGYERVVDLADLPESTLVGVALNDGEQVVLVRFGSAVYALQDCCSHADFPLSEGDVVDDYVIECALHGAQFDVRDGQALELPATEPLVTYAVRIDGEAVMVCRQEA